VLAILLRDRDRAGTAYRPYKTPYSRGTAPTRPGGDLQRKGAARGGPSRSGGSRRWWMGSQACDRTRTVAEVTLVGHESSATPSAPRGASTPKRTPRPTGRSANMRKHPSGRRGQTQDSKRAACRLNQTLHRHVLGGPMDVAQVELAVVTGRARKSVRDRAGATRLARYDDLKTGTGQSFADLEPGWPRGRQKEPGLPTGVRGHGGSTAAPRVGRVGDGQETSQDTFRRGTEVKREGWNRRYAAARVATSAARRGIRSDRNIDASRHRERYLWITCRIQDRWSVGFLY